MRKEGKGLRPEVAGVILVGLVGVASVATAGALFVHSGGTMEDMTWLAGLVVAAVTNSTEEGPEPVAAKTPAEQPRPQANVTPVVPPEG